MISYNSYFFILYSIVDKLVCYSRNCHVPGGSDEQEQQAALLSPLHTEGPGEEIYYESLLCDCSFFHI